MYKDRCLSHLFNPRCHLTFIVSRAGTRSVSTLSPAQYVKNFITVPRCEAFEQDLSWHSFGICWLISIRLARKRANDREAQRNIRLRTKVRQTTSWSIQTSGWDTEPSFTSKTHWIGLLTRYLGAYWEAGGPYWRTYLRPWIWCRARRGAEAQWGIRARSETIEWKSSTVEGWW